LNLKWLTQSGVTYINKPKTKNKNIPTINLY
jgi:hypothetical protein